MDETVKWLVVQVSLCCFNMESHYSRALVVSLSLNPCQIALRATYQTIDTPSCS
jgi:hypothetical protein